MSHPPSYSPSDSLPMNKDNLRRLELEFSEARMQVMQLRLENKRLEAALTVLSKPMVLSDDECCSESVKRVRLSDATDRAAEVGAIVIALPQGEAKERIDALVLENAKLAEEIVDLRRVSEDEPSSPSRSGVASIFEKNKELTNQVKQLELTMAEMDRNHASAIRQIQTKYDKESRQLASSLREVESVLNETKHELIKQKDEYGTQLHALKIHESKLTRENQVLLREIDQVYASANRVLQLQQDVGVTL